MIHDIELWGNYRGICSFYKLVKNKKHSRAFEHDMEGSSRSQLFWSLWRTLKSIPHPKPIQTYYSDLFRLFKTCENQETEVICLELEELPKRWRFEPFSPHLGVSHTANSVPLHHTKNTRTIACVEPSWRTIGWYFGCYFKTMTTNDNHHWVCSCLKPRYIGCCFHSIEAIGVLGFGILTIWQSPSMLSSVDIFCCPSRFRNHCPWPKRSWIASELCQGSLSQSKTLHIVNIDSMDLEAPLTDCQWPQTFHTYHIISRRCICDESKEQEWIGCAILLDMKHHLTARAPTWSSLALPWIP